MPLFKRPKPEPNPPRTSPALLDIQERMDRLERMVRDLRTDWDGQYDKFHRLNMRLAKRQKMIEEAEDRTEPEQLTLQNAPGSSNGGRSISNPLAERLLQRGGRS